ncbi:MAG: MauE/DoxX family redox-associated membrane protein [Limisphaerales bacterium]
MFRCLYGKSREGTYLQPMPETIILLLAAIFLLAAISKFRSRDAFSAVLRNLLPAVLVAPMSIFVPLVELLLAGFLLSGIAPQKAIIASIVMLVIFTLVLAEMWRRGLQGCACFGETVNTSTTSSGLIRNVILIAAALSILNEREPISFLGPDFSTFLGRLTVIIGALCLWPCLVALVSRRKLIFNY